MITLCTVMTCAPATKNCWFFSLLSVSSENWCSAGIRVLYPFPLCCVLALWLLYYPGAGNSLICISSFSVPWRLSKLSSKNNVEIKSHVDSNDLKNILELKFETDIRASNTIFPLLYSRVHSYFESSFSHSFCLLRSCKWASLGIWVGWILHNYLVNNYNKTNRKC